MLVALGVVTGPFAVALAVAIWVLTPSAKTLTRRVALNGAIALGALPLLWWAGSPPLGAVGRVGLILAVLSAVLVFCAILGGEPRRRLIPEFAASDTAVAAAGVFGLWFFLPFFTPRADVPALASLVQAFGGDNVAHFDMFEMIRRTLVTGPGWPTPADGSVFAYIVYPQHFHVLAVMAADGWSGVSTGTIAQEVALFGIGTSLVLTAALVTLAAAIASVDVLRGRTGLVFVVITASISFLFLGFGAASLSHGFPGFLLAVIGAIIAVVLAMSGRRTTVVSLAAVCASAVLVAHSWMLLAPLALVAAAVLAIRIDWAALRAAPRRAAPFALVVATTAAAGGFGAWLVVEATRTAGGPAAALTTTGGVATPSISLIVAIAGAAVAVAWSALVPGAVKGARVASTVVLGTVIVGAAEVAVLTAVQLSQADKLGYFQYKLIDGLTIVFAILAVLAGTVWVVARATPHASRRWMSVVTTLGLCAALLAYSGFPVPGFFRFPGLSFRDGPAMSAADPFAGLPRLLEAASVMADEPCVRPFYLAVLPGDLTVGVSNNWAMSLSSTWTERAGGITTALFDVAPETDAATVASTVDELLDADADRCVVVAPEALADLPVDVTDRYAGRILSWSTE